MSALPEELKGVLTSWQPGWDQFLSKHSQWLRSRLQETNEIFCVPIADRTSFACAFTLTPGEIAAEKTFLAVCRGFKIIGVRIVDYGDPRSSADLIRFDGLEPQTPSDTSWLERGRDVGWTDEMIQAARLAMQKSDEVDLRMTGATGRLVCMPAFLAERDVLRERWLSLPSNQRPSLPLRPIIRAASLPEPANVRCLSKAATQFAEALEIFCETWQVDGLETWALPRLRGPFWPDSRSAAVPSSFNATVSLTTPWHFPALDSDGLGDIAMEAIRAERRRRGIDDVRAWRQYGQLFRLDFWEQTFRERYADRPRPRDFVSQVERLLADSLDVSLERVERLRKLHHALQTGRRRSLAGVR
jgi:hypothetical protein